LRKQQIEFENGGMPYYELRSRLGMERKTPDQIADAIQAAYAQGKLPRRDTVSFAHMWSDPLGLVLTIGIRT
jgi:hypothetical protein